MTTPATAEKLADAGSIKEIDFNGASDRFGFNGGSEGCNTRIDYRLVDHMSGTSAKGSVVLAGRLTKEDVADLRDTLENGCNFEPFRAGIPDLNEKMPASWKDSGTSFHAIDRIAFTDHAEADYLPSAEQFASALSDDYGQYMSSGSV